MHSKHLCKWRNNLSPIQDSDNERQQRPIKCGIQALQYSKETYRSMDCLVDIPTLRRL